jgi:GNAT superfamily N-acetyltransferase
MVRLLVSTGEVSGDLQGSLLVKALYEEAARRSLPLDVVALGGSRMERAGAQLLADTTKLGAIGLWEPLGRMQLATGGFVYPVGDVAITGSGTAYVVGVLDAPATVGNNADAGTFGPVGVLPRARGHGLGEALTRAALHLLAAQGFDEVYHLEGGILKYLETVAPEASRWQGECFVFDERVSVAHGVQTGSHQLCRCCRQPLPPGALVSIEFELGVSCPRCFSQTSETQKKSARERQRQWERAKAKAALRDSEDGPISHDDHATLTGHG